MVDSNVAVQVLHAGRELNVLGDADLVAPPLLWSEFRSAVREAAWRGEIPAERPGRLLDALDASPLAPRTHKRLGHEALRIAEELGWSRTYDAEYVALAGLLGCRLVTLDGKLRRGTDRLGFVVTPSEL